MNRTVHMLKLKSEFCEAVSNGDKCFEIRYNDRGYQKGDFVNFVPIDKDGNKVEHKIINQTFEITYVLNGWGLQDGYVVFGIVER